MHSLFERARLLQRILSYRCIQHKPYFVRRTCKRFANYAINFFQFFH